MKVIGAPIEDQLDAEYGIWLVQQYNVVVESGRPALDYVTAQIKADSVQGSSRYERLLLPWWTNDHKVIVTCASVLISTEEISDASSRDLTTYHRPSLRDEAPEVRQELAARHAN